MTPFEIREDRMLLLFISCSILSCSTVAAVAREFLNPCAEAPSASARVICNQLHEWDRQARVSYYFCRWKNET